MKKITRLYFTSALVVLFLASCSHPESTTTEITAENHDVLMEEWVAEAKYDIKTLGILVYDGVNELDLMGPRYVLGQLWGVKTELIALKPGNIKTVMGVEIVPNTIIDSVEKVDILVIPGGFKGTIEGAYNQKLLDWIKKVDEQTTFTASVCTGGWILGATGLLEGKKATTNWYRAEEMLKKYGATFQNERFVRDGKYWTSAGVTAGMDMSLAIINEVRGEDYTQAVMLDMEYDPDPPVNGGTPEKTKPSVYQ
ncbi:MAG: DJ-1/PfpI family protein, partial [Bacteroidota bacterium]